MLTMFYTFLTPSHPIGTATVSFADGMPGLNVGKSVKKLDKQNYSYIMFGKQQAASSKQQAASSMLKLKLKLKDFIL
jgi:hypothetical protein